MKIKFWGTMLLVVFSCMACNKDNVDLNMKPNDSNNTNNGSPAKSLTIKNAKYIYQAQTQSKADGGSSFRQITRDNKDEALYWITEVGDSISAAGISFAKNLDDRYILIINSDLLSNIDMQRGDYHYLVDKKTEAIYYIPITFDPQAPSNFPYPLGRSPFRVCEVTKTDDGMLYLAINSMESNKADLYKLHLSNPQNPQIELYLENTWQCNYLINSGGVCFYGDLYNPTKKYIRKGITTYPVSQLIKAGNAFAGFLSNDNKKLYIASVSYETMKLSVYEVKDNGGEMKVDFVSEIGIEGGGNIMTAKQNGIRKSILINIRQAATYEFEESTSSLKGVQSDLSGFFLDENYSDKESFLVSNALYVWDKDMKLDVFSLADYSTKTLDLLSHGIEFKRIMMTAGSDILNFTGFRYADSQSVIGTIDINGTVHVESAGSASTIIDLIKIN